MLVAPCAGPVELGVPADLGHVGVAGDGAVARALRAGRVRARRDVGLLEEGQRAFPAQELEGALALVPRAGPELDVRQVDLVERQDLHELPRTLTIAGPPVCCSHVRHAVRAWAWGAWSSPRIRDRPAGEVQLAVPFGRRPTAGCILRTQYLSIGDTGAHAALLSCPTWLWGAEHGVNEFGVAIGNERVATVHDAAQAPPRLIGMDLVRLGLERARSAAEALDMLVDLLTTHGQGGIADAVHHEAYDSSFLIADPAQAFVLDTSGTDFAAAPFPAAPPSATGSAWGRTGRGSPDLDDGDDFGRFGDPDRAHRLRRSPAGGEPPVPGRAAGRGRRSHPGRHGGPPAPPRQRAAGGARRRSGCLHAPSRAQRHDGLPDRRVAHRGSRRCAMCAAYVALGSPCVSIYVPAFVRTAAGPPPFVPRELSNETMWWAAEALRQRVEEDPDALGPIREILDPVEEELWFEAGQIAETPDRWPDVAGSWGGRALAALQSCAP